MSFYPRRRRTAPPIIIISLIDVLIVMLTFIMVTTTYRSQPSVRLALPDVGDGLREGATESRPPLVVTIPPGDAAYFIGTREVDADLLGRELRDRAAADPQLQLVLRADREASWERVARALKLAREAQIQSVRAVTQAAGPGR